MSFGSDLVVGLLAPRSICYLYTRIWRRGGSETRLVSFTAQCRQNRGLPNCSIRILDLVCKQYFADQHSRNPDKVFMPVLLGTDNPQCQIPEVSADSAKFLLVMGLFTGVLSAVVAPKIGHLSDRYGRTRLMALASVGGVLNEFITILVAKYPDTIDYRWLLLGSIFDGMTGSFTAGSVMSQSYTSDCTPPSKRAVFMGYMHACLFAGLAFGPLLGGYFVKWTGSLVSIFYVVMGMNKLDRDVRDPMEVLDEVENELGMMCAPITWPIGCGKD